MLPKISIEKITSVAIQELKPTGKKVLLIFPHPVSQPPGGLASIAPIFIQYGYQVKIVINTFRKYLSNNDIMDIVRQYKPAIVGLSFSTFRILDTYELMGRIKSSGAIVLAGGVHPTVRPEESLEHGCDIVVIGEGEITVDELCQYWTRQGFSSLDKIAGLCFKNAGGTAIRTLSRPRITDLEKLPLPDIKMYDLELFRMPDGRIKAGNKIFMSRGCPFQCTFCDRSVFGSKHMSRSAKSVIGQIMKLKEEYGYQEFCLDDDNFMLNKQNACRICELILERRLNIRWLVASHINTADAELLQLMKRAGCYQIIYGAESGDDETLKRIRKGYTRQDIIDTVKLSHKLGLQIYVNLMTGFPWETPRHVQNTIELVQEITPMVYAFQCYGAVVPYPNTPIYEEYKDEFGFNDWWLRERFQDAGMVIYQNVSNPYAISSYFQRNLYDDTYICEDYFFKYTSEYKRKVKEMLFLIGRHNLKARYKSKLKQTSAYTLGKISRFFYEIDPRIERRMVSLFHPKNIVHESREVARFTES